MKAAITDERAGLVHIGDLLPALVAKLAIAHRRNRRRRRRSASPGQLSLSLGSRSELQYATGRASVGPVV